MFSHIPEEIFCPQVSGNINDALRVLKVSVKGPEKNSHFFDFELSLVDPENPVTQISKTPSDEEFPWCGEDTDADVPSTPKDHEQVSKPQLEVECIMENKEKKTFDENENLKDEEPIDAAGIEYAVEEEKKNLTPDYEENAILGGKDVNSQKISGQNNYFESKQEENELYAEKVDANVTDKETGEFQKTSSNLEEKDQAMDLLKVPKVDDTESQAPSEVSSVEDSAIREKKEKEEKIMANYKSLAFPKRSRSTIKTELLVKDVKKFIEDMKKQTAPEDLDVRIIPSNMACRFELPIDLTRLKGETPLSYVRKYCKVTESRRTIYKDKFEQFKSEHSITVLNLQKVYEALYQESSLQDDVMHLQRLLGLHLSTELDMETFIPVSCFMERIILRSQGRGPTQGYKKNVFEVTSFSALNGKLQDIEISPELMDLLKYIRGN